VSTSSANASFAEIWRSSSEQLLAGKSTVDIEAPRRWPLYSFVCRVPQAAATEAVNALTSANPGWTEHYIYPPPTIHMTVLFLTPYLGIESQMDPVLVRGRIGDAEEIAREVFAGFGPVTFRAHGLNAFPSTVFLQLLPEDPEMPFELRKALAEKLKAAEIPGATPADYESRKPLALAYGNIARFRHTVAQSFIPSIQKNRDTDFGEVTFDTIELVKSDKLLSERRTESIARFALT